MLGLIPSAGRGLIMFGLLACLTLGVSACGRRGQPEAPPDPSVPAQQQQSKKTADTKPETSGRPTLTGTSTAEASDEDEPDDSVTPNVSPQPTPPHRRTRVYTVPKEPFILDPLL